MNLTNTEKKLLLLAMDKGASDGEIAAAATKFIRSLRERYRDGHQLIEHIQVKNEAADAFSRGQRPKQKDPWSEPQQWPPPNWPPNFDPAADQSGGTAFGFSQTRPFGQPPPNPNQPKPQPNPSGPMGSDFFKSWERQRQETWADYVARAQAASQQRGMSREEMADLLKSVAAARRAAERVHSDGGYVPQAAGDKKPKDSFWKDLLQEVMDLMH